MKLNDLFLTYLEDIELTHQPSTIDIIKYRYYSNISIYFGDMELEDITADKIKKFQRELISGKNKKEKKLSAGYVNIIISLFKRLLKYAYLMEYINTDYKYIKSLNTIQDVIDKDAYIDRQTIWRIPEFNQFIEFVSDEQYYLLFNVLYFCGLRKGEALALKWRNIDLIKGTITIESTASRVTGVGQILKSPKSINSYRTIFINDTLLELILNYYLKKRKNYKNIKNLFVFGDFKMISFTTLDRNFYKYKKISGVTDMNLHGFRHSHATILLELTDDIYTVSKRLGHYSVDITEKYLHYADKAQKELIKKLEKEVKNIKDYSMFNDFISDLEERILLELDNSVYNNEEINKIISIFNFIKKIKNE